MEPLQLSHMKPAFQGLVRRSWCNQFVDIIKAHNLFGMHSSIAEVMTDMQDSETARQAPVLSI